MRSQQASRKFFWVAISVILLVSGFFVAADIAEQAAGNTELVITEFLAANRTGLLDEDGDFSDWIEIYNRSDHPVNLSGWALTDDPTQPAKWSFPETTIGSGEYLVVFASGKNRKTERMDKALHTNFKLSHNLEFLGLYSILDNRFSDEIVLDSVEQFDDMAFGRQQNDTGYLVSPSPGISNENAMLLQPELVNASNSDSDKGEQVDAVVQSNTLNEPYLTADSDARIAWLSITEIMYNPTGGDDYEFIELRNNSDIPVNVSGASFEGINFTFPFGSPLVEPGQMVVLVSNAEAFAQRYPDIPVTGVYSGQLSNKGEDIFLKDGTGNILAAVSYNDENGWPLSADGMGDSLVLIHPDSNPNNPKNWRASSQLDGSPGMEHVTMAQTLFSPM